MELIGTDSRACAYPLDPAHPNYERWRRGIDASVLRGGLVADILSRHVDLTGKRILDAGCGVGGTSHVLRERGAEVVSADVDPRRLRRARSDDSRDATALLDVSRLPFTDGAFDGVVLQDVLEHLPDPGAALREIRRILRRGGFLYLATPSRFSLINLLSDPHWGLPVVALLRRGGIRFFLHRVLKREADRRDFAELLSFRRLETLLRKNRFGMELHQRLVAAELFREPGRIAWSPLHLRLIELASKCGLRKIFLRTASDRPGLFNRVIAPEWYCVCEAL